MKSRWWLSVIVLTLLFAGLRVSFGQGPLQNGMNVQTRTSTGGDLSVHVGIVGAQGPLTNLGNLMLRTYGGGDLGVAINGGIATPDTLCISSTTKDSYWQEVGANDPGLFTGGTNCATGTVRLDVTSTRALFAEQVQGPYGTAAAVGLGIDANTGWYGSAGVMRLSCGNSANCAVFTSGAATVAGSFGATSYSLVNMTFSSAAPTISAFGGTGAAVVAGSSTAAWRIGVGTVAPGTTGTINLPTATTGWNCWVTDQTNPLDITRQTSSGTSSVGITSTIAWSASDILVGGCAAF
jgi:hypothetical protein